MTMMVGTLTLHLHRAPRPQAYTVLFHRCPQDRIFIRPHSVSMASLVAARCLSLPMTVMMKLGMTMHRQTHHH